MMFSIKINSTYCLLIVKEISLPNIYTKKHNMKYTQSYKLMNHLRSIIFHK